VLDTTDPYNVTISTAKGEWPDGEGAPQPNPWVVIMKVEDEDCPRMDLDNPSFHLRKTKGGAMYREAFGCLRDTRVLAHYWESDKYKFDRRKLLTLMLESLRKIP
jgi:hypothetical protein